MDPQAPPFELIDLPGVTTPQCSVVAVDGEPGRIPTLFVHGIIDNVRRWITPDDDGGAGLDLPDPTMSPVIFDPHRSRTIAGATVSARFEGAGLLERFARLGRPAVAFSYQDRRRPVACMAEALEKLHRVAAWACVRWGARRLHLVGHSRGGLVCRHALLGDSAVMSAADFLGRVDRLITICTPHLGSSLAGVSVPLKKTLARLGGLAAKLAEPAADARAPLEGFRALLENLSQLTPDSDEVRRAASESLPPLPGGYFAIAGSVPTFFACELPLVGRLRIPPPLPRVREFSDGKGDMAVAIESALDIPGRAPDRTLVLPVNHVTATYDPAVHEALLEWTGG